MSDQPENSINIDRNAFHEVVQHPQAHALILGQYRVGEYAGVVGLRRLLGEMQPEGKLHQAMTIHFQDEGRHQPCGERLKPINHSEPEGPYLALLLFRW